MIGDEIHTSICGDDFGFPVVNYPWLKVMMFIDSFISQLIFLLGSAQGFKISIKIYKSPLNCCHKVIDITGFVKHLGNFLDPSLNFYQN